MEESEEPSPLKRRRPWLAALGNAVGSPLGHVYAGAPARGLILVTVFSGVQVAGGWLSVRVTSVALLVLILLGMTVGYFVMVVDAFIVARRANPYRLRPYNRWYAYLGLYVAIALVGSAVGAIDPVQTFKIPSGAMIPTILVGDHVLVDKRAYRKVPPKRGDIVVFDYPKDPQKAFVKRVIGLPGETVKVRDKVVFVNGSELKERYAAYDEDPNAPRMERRDEMETTLVPDGRYFMMGDNRDRSYDSRFWGPASEEAIQGRVHVIYWSWNPEDFSVRWDRIGRLVR